MKNLLYLFFSLLLFSATVYGQDYKKHKVEKGETITDIAKKYKVTPYDIYRLNPDARNGIAANTILLIPVQYKNPETPAEKAQPSKVSNTVHVVKAKETLYGLSKQYNVSEEDIIKANGHLLDEGLKIGQEVIIPIKGDPVKAQVKAVEKEEVKKDTSAYIYHIVETGETKFSIAQQYDMTVQLIEELNPEVKEILPLGYKLKLVDKKAIESAPVKNTEVAVAPAFIMYSVPAKETFYSLTRDTGLSREKLEELNPELKDGLKEGMVLKLPAGTTVGGTVPGAMVAGREYTNLMATLNRNAGTKELVLLLPFNVSKMDSDTTRTRQDILKNDKFLNMTLDFYSGALMAIDSANALGLPLHVRIMDSNESRNTSNVARLKASLMNANAVIGPFFSGNAETAAVLLDTIPVISPLSREASGKPHKNLYYSVPDQDMERQAMMDYLKSRGGNIVAIIDPKRASSKHFLTENYPGVKFVNGAVTQESLRPLLVKDTINYVILDTESTELILNSTKALQDAQENYHIQLAVFEKNDQLDNDEAFQRLVGLKMLYPTVTKDGETPEGIQFARKFKEENGYYPNDYASRGFDITFDVILRLFQPEAFGKGIQDFASEQVENRFNYKFMKGSNYNTGIYIMYYDEDLTTKQAE